VEDPHLGDMKGRGRKTGGAIALHEVEEKDYVHPME